MRYLALATDYDGTLAEHGAVEPSTLSAIQRVRESGRRLVLVTGRQLDDLVRVFPDYGVFDRVVAENGAVVFSPESREERVFGEPPPKELIERLAACDVTPLSAGRVIVATWAPHENTVLKVIHELGLELQVIFNKGAVMILPTGINKARGLRSALLDLSLSPHNVVAIGDAENDHALLAECEFSAAVANALPTLKERADWVTPSARGAGVSELVDRLVTSDLREFERRMTRHDIVIGRSECNARAAIHPYGRRVLLCGTSGSGKSTLAGSFLERLTERGYQSCLLDPEGDFDSRELALVLGDENNAPKPEEVVAVLRSVDQSVVVNLLALPLEQRPIYHASLMAHCADLRARTGRPAWFIIDEAHHMLTFDGVSPEEYPTHPPSGVMLITVHHDKLPLGTLREVDTLIVVGDEARATMEHFARTVGQRTPGLAGGELEAGEAVLWSCLEEHPPIRFRPFPCKVQRRRHRRKYAAGALGKDKSFYFRGPHNRLNLRAHNLMLFLQIGEGVDDRTWLHHLRQNDYSRWIRSAIKNDDLADEVEAVERDASSEADVSRQRIREAVERVYTLPA